MIITVLFYEKWLQLVSAKVMCAERRMSSLLSGSPGSVKNW